MNSLSIKTTYGKIGIQTTPSKLEIRTQNASLEYTLEHPRIEITSSKPQIRIDQTEAFASAGLKSVFRLTKEAAQRGMQMSLEAIGNFAAEGSMLAAIENGGNPIAQIAKNNAYTQKQFGMVTMPSVPPKIDLIPGDVRINVPALRNSAHIGYSAQYIPGGVSINYSPARVGTYMQQWPTIKIDFVGNNIDYRV